MGFPKRDRLTGAALIACAASLAVPIALARGSAPPTPWDGTNPYHCVLQNAGLGPTGPDPSADPYCIYFDKTHQNVDQGGIVDFISKEPARTAAASPKCFYFQADHWRSSVVQSDSSTVVYEWVGHYFFNKATGDGGVWVSGFSLNGHTFDPTTIPGFPPQYGQYFGPGTGGMITHDSVPVDPSCAARAAQDPASIYAASANVPRCVATPASVAPSRLGPVQLGESESQVRAALGPPASVERGFLHYCVVAGNKFLVGEPGDRSGTLGQSATTRTVVVMTTSRGFALTGRGGTRVVVGAPASALKRAFPHAKRLIRIGLTVAYLATGRDVLVGIRQGRVRYVAIYDRKSIRNLRSLADYIRRA